MTVRWLAVIPLALALACGSNNKNGPGPGGLPAAVANGTPLNGPAPLDVAFTCTVTGGDAPLTFEWDFGDGTTSTEQNPAHTYADPGTFIATCLVTDADGETDTSPVQITAKAPDHAPNAAVNVLNTTKPDCAVTNQTTVQLSGVNSTDADNDVLTYQWTMLGAPVGSSAQLSTPTSATSSFSPDLDGAYMVRLHVADPGGLSDDFDLTITSQSASVITVVSGNNQTAPGGTALPTALTFEVQTACGLPVTNQLVTFTPTTGTVSPTSGYSDSTGQVTTSATIGCQNGSGMVTAALYNSPGVSMAAGYTATQGPGVAVVLQKPTNVQVPGPMSVRAEIHDACGNLVATDNTTSFTLSITEATVDASAQFTGVTTGTALDTTNPRAWIVKVAGGVVVATLSDSAAETISFFMQDTAGTGLNFQGGTGSSYDSTQLALPISCNGGTINVMFTNVPAPQGAGTISISGQIDSDDSTEYLYVYADSSYLGTTFGTQPDCAQQSGSVPASQSTLATAAADGTITVAITTGSQVDCFCADTIDVELTYPASTTADFTP